MNHGYDGWEGELISDDEDDLLADYRYTKNSILFCIEATRTMLEPTLDLDPTTSSAFSQPTPTASTSTSTTTNTARQEIKNLGWNGKKPPKSKLEVVLLAAYAMMKRKVIASPKDHVGILIWNTATTETPSDTKLDNSVTLFVPDQITAKSIRELKELLEACEEDEYHLARTFAPKEGAPKIAEAFGHCSTLLVQHSPTAQKSIYWITDNDDPVRGVSQLFKVAMNKRKDLKEREIDLQPFFIPPNPGQRFDLEKFYGDIISIPSDSDFDSSSSQEAVEYPMVHESLELVLFTMISNIKLKESTKRVAFRIPFELSKGFVIGVCGYNMVGEEKKKKSTKIDLKTESGQEVVAKVVYKDGESGQELQPGEIKKYFQVGQSNLDTGVQAAKIFFTEQEIRTIKALGRPPGLKLLGFLPREGNLRFEQTVKQSYFVYPEEERWEGSTRTFASLLKSMLKKDVIAYGSFIGRKASKPQVVILIPQAEELNAAGVQIHPPGLHLCQLPFADDLRELNIGRTVSCFQVDEDGDFLEDQPAVEMASKIVRHLTKKYNPDVYPNPALNFFYDTLAAIALNEDLPEPEDATIPAYHMIDARAGNYVEKLRKIIPQEDYDSTRIETSKSVRPRKAHELPSVNADDVSEFVEELREEKGGDLNGFKVPELKAFCKKIGQTTSGTKGLLVGRIQEYLEAQGLLGGDGEQNEKKKKRKVKKEESDDSDVEVMQVDGEEEPSAKGSSSSNRKKKIVKDDSDDE